MFGLWMKWASKKGKGSRQVIRVYWVGIIWVLFSLGVSLVCKYFTRTIVVIIAKFKDLICEFPNVDIRTTFANCE